jgi:hypothetical protein
MILVGIIVLLLGVIIILGKKVFLLKTHLPEEYYLTIVPFVLLSGASLFLLGIGFHSQILNDRKTEYTIAIITTIVLGFFSVFSYFIAVRIEKSIRERIDNFADFVEMAYKVFEETSTQYRIMVIYPYFGLLNYVQKKSQGAARKFKLDEINAIILNYLKENKIKMLIGKDEVCKKFLEKVNSHPDVNTKAVERSVNIIEQYQSLSPDAIRRCDFENPIHMIIGEKRAVWGSVGKPGECTGFYTADKDIVESLKKLFDIFYERSGKTSS